MASDPLIPVTAAGGVVYRETGKDVFILLIFRNNVWELPKGQLDSGESIESCAAREVAEETGIPEPEIGFPLITTTHAYEMNGKHYEKTTHWFAMHSDASVFIPQTKEGITQVSWALLDEAQKMVGYENLRAVLKDFKGKFMQG